ncbi:MAG: hypothetical protein ACRETR_02620, partial [Steroidobacteraceae bacterium]
AKGLFVMVNRLPDSSDLEVSIINFGDATVDEAVPIKGAVPAMRVSNLLDPTASALTVDAAGSLRVSLKGYEWRALRLTRASP